MKVERTLPYGYNEKKENKKETRERAIQDMYKWFTLLD
jgi:hypothetical protein